MQLGFYLNGVLMACLIVLSMPVLILFVQTVLAFFKNNKKQSTFNYHLLTRPRVGLLIPAHNEEKGIQQTIAALKPQLSADDQLIVIADNCSDQTAKLAEQASAVVIERFNQTNKGKGYALDYGIKHLSSMAPEVLVIVDADCIVAEDFIEKVTKACIAMNRPVQVDYLMEFPGERSIKQKIIEFAWTVKNKVRPTGYKMLGFPCQLMGTGMAFLWEDITKCNIASGNIVEDMQLGLDLAAMRKAPYYLADTNVSSFFPTSDEGVEAQRKRWEHGHIGVILNGLPLAIKALMTANIKLFMQILDLIVPPLALLMMLVLASMVFSGLIYVFYGGILTLLYAVSLFALLSLSIFIAWVGYGKHIVTLKELLYAPFILLMKLPLYLGFIFNRQAEWVRSKRD